MQSQAVELSLDGGDDSWMPMSEREYAEAPETIQEFAPVDVAHKATFALPLDDRVIEAARFRPAAEIAVETLHALSNGSILFLVHSRQRANSHKRYCNCLAGCLA